MLFRGEQVKKRISVLSGGERARLCLAGLLLSHHNILVLDEPGNHLDDRHGQRLQPKRLVGYKGTVIFTSHDRHFMKRVATCIVEVRDGHVTTYRGDYDSYLYAVNKEIEEGERELAAKTTTRPAGGKPAKGAPRPARRGEREVRKEITNLERTIAKLDDQKKDLNRQLLAATDPKEAACDCTTEVTALVPQLADAEERWCRLQEEIGEIRRG